MFHDLVSTLPTPEFNATLVFGVLILLGVLGGILANRISWLPTITGFMAVGLLMGPSVLKILNPAALAMAKGFVDIALGLILFKLGSAIHPKEILSNPRLVVTSVIESMLTFVSVLGVLYLFGIPPGVCLLVAAIFVSSSPAILVHVAHEVGAAGRITNSAKSLVALNNVFSFILFTALMPLATHIGDQSLLAGLATSFYRLFGSLALGIALAFVITRLTRLLDGRSTHFIFPIVVAGIMITLGLSAVFHLSFLFAALTLGAATRWLELKYMPLTKVDFGYAEDIFFIVLFVSAGANLHVSDMISVGFVAPCIIAVRCAAKYIAVTGCGRFADYSPEKASARGLLVLPMAGLALGLVQTTGALAPEISTQVSALVFAAVAVLETAGPPLTKIAFDMAGETGKAHAAEGKAKNA